MKGKNKISIELILGLSALTISIATMFVYVRQASIMKEQQVASVWPYLEILPSWGPQGLSLTVINKGIGPALVKDVTMKLNEKVVPDLDSLFYMVTDTAFDDFGYSTVKGRVIASGEVIQVFMIDKQELGKKIRSRLTEMNFEYEICYCSVYNDCWRVKGLEVSTSDCH